MLIKSLDDNSALRRSSTEKAPSDILSTNVRKAEALKPRDFKPSRLGQKQQDILMSLLNEYAARHAPDIAAARLDRVRAAGLGNMFFAWRAGSKRVSRITIASRVRRSLWSTTTFRTMQTTSTQSGEISLLISELTYWRFTTSKITGERSKRTARGARLSLFSFNFGVEIGQHASSWLPRSCYLRIRKRSETRSVES